MGAVFSFQGHTKASMDRDKQRGRGKATGSTAATGMRDDYEVTFPGFSLCGWAQMDTRMN